MKNRRGFTLLELLLVMFIVGVLVTGIVATFGPAARIKAYQATIDQNLGVIRIAVMGYFQENGSYPTGMAALITSGYLETTFAATGTGVDYTVTGTGGVQGTRTIDPYKAGYVSINASGVRTVGGASGWK